MGQIRADSRRGTVQACGIEARHAPHVPARDGLSPGYFGPHAFTFGAPRQRLTLAAIVGAVPDVLAVKDVQIGARAIHEMRKMEAMYVVPDDQILRLANDPRTPEKGSIRVITEGGV